MTLKGIITGLLLLFVAISLGTLVVQETGVLDKPKEYTGTKEEAMGISADKRQLNAEKGQSNADKDLSNAGAQLNADKGLSCTDDLLNTTKVKAALANKVIVYYFHGNARCKTCLAIETYSKEAIDSSFGEALKSGELEWRTVNVDESENSHYIEDFQLSTRSVVLERIAEGKRESWKDLQQVWDYIRGDKEEFLQYIQQETKAYLEGLPI
ncbi:MAG: hypothetical protein HQL32_14560 [Planctomycetes bacterium]|nr:hypothetical protein [Planctomycetota bacterium]